MPLNYVGEVREGAERVGFEVVTIDGRRGPLASTIITRYYYLLVCFLVSHR